MTRFKKNRTGLGSRQHPLPDSPAPAPANACLWAWFSPKHTRKFQVPKGHTLCSYLSLFKHFKCLLRIQFGTKCFSYHLVRFSYWIRLTFDLNISFIWKRNWTFEYTTLILSTDLALIQLKDSLKFFVFPTVAWCSLLVDYNGTFISLAL